MFKSLPKESKPFNPSAKRTVRHHGPHGGGAADRLRDLDPARLPHFFIMGAPRCGTTALYTYLKGHPDTFMATQINGRKIEPQFFCTDFPGIWQLESSQSYQALFDQAPRHALRGETSPWYLYSQVAAKNIVEHVPDAKLIVLLRNPIDMVQSLHSRLLISMREDVDDFERAWQLQEARRVGEKLPRYCREPSHLQYGQVCSFAPQLERLFQHAGRDRVRVVLFEELIANPRATYLALLDFLGLPDDGRTEFPKINEGVVHRSRTVVDVLHNLPPAVDPLLYFAKRMLNRSGVQPLHLLKQANAKPQPRVQLQPSFLRHLTAFFSSDVRATEALLGRPLELWWTRMQAA